MDKFREKYNGLNREQREAVDTIYGPVMVVAGPGTGKTTVLTLRIANILLKSDTKPNEILALTFTENGVRAMREKLRDLIGDESFRVNIFTFHGFANYIRGLYPEYFTKIGERVSAGDFDKIQILEYILANKSYKELRISQFGVSLSKISSRISDLKRENIGPDSLTKLLDNGEGKVEGKEKYYERIREFADLYREYENELDKRSFYDFDDAILDLIQSLKDNPTMLYEIRENFQFILADEHQDANGAQNEILRLFKSEGDDAPNIFVVGDDKQSIFRFQGASLDHFYNFSSEFPGAKIISLEENYRSQRIILDSSHSLITKDGKSHKALRHNALHKERKIDILEFSDYESELTQVAKEIKHIVHGYGGSESIAVISRYNKTLFDLSIYLEAEGVDFKIKGERSLFEDFEYHKLFLLLSSISNPYEGRLLSALYLGYFNIPIEQVLSMVNDARGKRLDVANVILESEVGNSIKLLIAKAKKTPLIDFLKELRRDMYQNAGSGAYDALRSVFEESRKLVINKRNSTLDDLVSHLRFLEKYNLAPLSSESSDDSNVELLTAHRSKGLEYDFVFIVDVTESKFGKGRRSDLLAIPGIGTENELEEERRLLYVAITRARKCATISYSLVDEKGGNAMPAALIREIDSKFVEKKIYSKEILKTNLLEVGISSNKKKEDVFRSVFLSRNFSVSALNSFISCPWKYFFRYVLSIPDAPEFNSLLGIASHNVLRGFHLATKKGNMPSRKEMDNLIERSILAEPFTEPDILIAKEKVSEYVHSYIKGFVGFSKNEDVYVEEKFSFIYNVKDEGLSFDVSITGKIDLLRVTDGLATVYDFKTKKRMTRNAIMGNTKNDDGNEYRQLQFYKFLIENTSPNINVKLGTLTFLSPDDGVVRSEIFELSEDDKLNINKKLDETLLSIYRFDFWDKKCGKKDCEYCKLSDLIIKNSHN